MSTPSEWAAGYLGRLNIPIIFTPPGAKGPRSKGWQLIENSVRDPAAAINHLRHHRHDGFATVLQHAGLVSMDVDDETNTVQVFERFSIDLAELRRNYPCIRSRPGRFRIMFRAPAAPLTAHTLRWPRQGDPKRFGVIFELRAGLLADTLPPTRHVATGLPYIWEAPPRGGFRELPPALLALWQDWPETERTGLAVCPWYVPPPPRPARTPKARDSNTPSVIAAFNEASDIAAILESAGYVKKGNRFAKPGSQHAAGLKLLDSGRVFCHHAGDILGDGRAHDAFDVWATLQYGGNVHVAVRAAAKMLGMGERR